MALAECGSPFEVATSVDGAEALDYLFQRDDPAAWSVRHIPDLVLLDLNMPKVGGLEVLREVRGRIEFDRTFIVIFTSSSDLRYRSRALEMGADLFQSKHTRFADFMDFLRSLVDRRRGGSPRPDGRADFDSAV